ncbi:hypothetical protein [Hydrogenophaga sp.]|uniref:hypothetical protein n=1 Tax=Hydrogenophaga sp. TaxID=1904254 RepID=UPI003F72638C
MTVVVQTPYNAHIANGVTTLFGFTFQLLQEGDLQVSLDGVVQMSGYTVAGVGVQAGGSITFSVAPGNNVLVEIQRDIPLARSTDYQENGDLPSKTLDEDIDRVWQAMQDAAYFAALSVSLPPGDTAAPMVLPSVGGRSGKFLAFDGSGNAIAADTLGAGVVVTPFMETLLDDTNAAGARSTLGAQAAGSYANSGSVAASGLTMSTARMLARTTASTGPIEELTSAQGRAFVAAVGLAGNETVAGVKTLSSAPVLQAGAAFGSATMANLATAAPIFGARAFGIFDGRTTGTFAPNNAGNVTSITRTTTGTYTVNLAAALGSTDYVVVCDCRNTSLATYAIVNNESNTTSSFVITTKQEGGSLVDCAYVSFVVYRT